MSLLQRTAAAARRGRARHVRRRRPRRGARSRAEALAALLALTALVSGAAGAGLLLATGAGNQTTSTTITQAQAPATTAASETTGATGLNAQRALLRHGPRRRRHHLPRGHDDLRRRRRPSAGRRSPRATATGTGFVVDGKGHIVTAAHVVDGASSITVKFQDGTTRTAKLLGKDNATDVAVLSVDPSGLTLHPLALGSSAALDVGDQLAAIGDPFTYERSMSTGIVSGLDRTISAPNGFTVAHAIQTDAALNPGNSGGPVLDAAGKVIGIVDQIATNGSSDTSSGVGFAVPIDLVKSELSQLEAGQTVSHAYLGVSTSTRGHVEPRRAHPERDERRPGRRRGPARRRRRDRARLDHDQGHQRPGRDDRHAPARRPRRRDRPPWLADRSRSR